MTETNENKAIKLLGVYIKDVSFEAPDGPVISLQTAGPKTDLNIKSSSSKKGEDRYEVLITLSIKAHLEDKTLFLVEIVQAGMFEIKGFEEKELSLILGTYALNQIFPFAREQVAKLVASGGFPPLLLQPINFDALYAKSQAQNNESSTENIKIH
jgi:preprotein translocase subunit SecB